MSTEEAIRAKLQTNPGDPLFADLVELLREQKQYQEAIFICLSGLSANPLCYKGRLLLARILHECNFFPFAIRELRDLMNDLPQNNTIKRLTEVMAQQSDSTVLNTEGEETLAETEFDVDDME